MTKVKSTKRALIMSAIALVVCLTMLIGSTYAWFTDSVTSAGNKIQAGNLDVELYLWNSANDADKEAISTKTEPVFGAEDSLTANENNADTLWEPGKTQVAYFSIKNEGNLDLKYKIAINVTNSKKNLHEVMEYEITPGAQYGSITGWADNGTAVALGTNVTNVNDVALTAGQEAFFALSVHMLEEAGNQYMNGSVDFDIQVLAGQLVSESDSFDNTYDTYAAYAGTSYAPIISGQAAEVQVKDENDAKVGSFVIPADAMDASASQIKVIVDDSTYEPNISVAANATVDTFDVKVLGIKEDNTTPIKVQLRIAKDLDPATVEVYHYDTKITDATYNPNTGYVTFETTSFSPFSIVYDADSKYVAPEVEENELPKAVVTELAKSDYENIEWGQYGQWSPTAGLEANLEAAYKFACPETFDVAKDKDYANWYCDFYVSLDKPLGANQIFLGGNYGSFGWVGFHNGELTLKAGEEVALLGSVTTNPWTYLDVVQYVGEFICGVGDVNDSLSGATFTVNLRLTNPEDDKEFYDVNTVKYTFN